jgi:hypothetical protein
LERISVRLLSASGVLTLLLVPFCGRAVAAEPPHASDEEVPRANPPGIRPAQVIESPPPRRELSVGLGNGISASNALQWSVMPRLRGGDEGDAFTFGVGLSGGEYAGLCIGCGKDDTTTLNPAYYTVWANFEIGGEHLSREGFAFRYFLGIAQDIRASRASLPVPYVGVGFGYAF